MIVVDGLVVVTVPGSLDVDGAEVDRPVGATDPRSLDVDGAVVDSLVAATDPRSLDVDGAVVDSLKIIKPSISICTFQNITHSISFG
ncbi:hypothetical protein DPMN_176366 [Dreissena polymorpha]|uniref:Uncharacterized protein n=1 Tax=Dreissena polymorpha TaxID=45954 RepID=A0A9D4E9Z1_DREPO|nr:hypothetical protein DPMN_176366 [Dreissena polymorpha]